METFSDGGMGRVLVLTDLDEVQHGRKYEIVLLGVCNKVQEEVITLLKTAELLKECEWQVENDAMLDAIRKLNEECENKLINLAECRNIRACNGEDIKKRCGWLPYCEDPRLSINNPGMLYKALYVPPETDTLDDAKRDKVLASLVCWYDLSTCKPKPNCKSKVKWAAHNWMIGAQAAAKAAEQSAFVEELEPGDEAAYAMQSRL